MSAAPPRSKVYLASRSPRRRELLKQIGVAFEVLMLRDHPGRNVDVDESQQPGEGPDEYVRRACRAKADSGWQRVVQRHLRPFPVLAADTVVCVDEIILGKPPDAAHAAKMLRLLSGREHRVLTAVALKFDDRGELLVSESRVRFADLSQAEIEAYVASGEPTDKAGGYAIQGRAGAFVTELHGSYSGVMGLPLYETSQLIRNF
ncbi:MAG TPA: Maf family protein [Burkholderiales bacterium]|nr:Maf family protein [Burkholderiales bacterium]